MSQQTIPSTQDVVICGGGLAGLLLARQLRQQMPDLSVAVIDRMARPLPDAAHKVGESSVELGCQYLEELGLRPEGVKLSVRRLGQLIFQPAQQKQVLITFFWHDFTVYYSENIFSIVTLP